MATKAASLSSAPLRSMGVSVAPSPDHWCKSSGKLPGVLELPAVALVANVLKTTTLVKSATAAKCRFAPDQYVGKTATYLAMTIAINRAKN